MIAMNAKTQIEDTEVPEGVCIMAEIPDKSVALLGAVEVNPYKMAPLTAIIRDGGNLIQSVAVSVLGKGDRGIAIRYDVSDHFLWTYGGIPVFGLYPDHVNQVQVVFTLAGQRHEQHFEIYGPAIRLPTVASQSAPLPLVEPITVAPGFEQRLYFFNHLVTNLPGTRQLKWNTPGGAAEWDSVGVNWISDSNGDVRWYLDTEQFHDSTRKDGIGVSSGFHQTRDGKLIWGQGQTYSKFDLMGKKIWQRDLPDKFADFSHEIRETSIGTYLLRVGTSDYLRTDGKHVRSIRDHIIEINESGDVVEYWDLNKILDPYRDDLLQAFGGDSLLLPGGTNKKDNIAKNELLEGDLPFGDKPGVGTGRNWAHVNSIDYDPNDDSIIVSARHQGVVKIGRDKKVKWILASPKGWNTELADKVLTPVNAAGQALEIKDGVYGENFDWPWTQHSAWKTERGTLTVFDNGWGRNFSPTKLHGNYSRAVEYKIDEEKGTVEQLWEYGKDRGDEWYSPITSNIQYQADTDTQLIYSASINFLTKEKMTTTVLTEIEYGSDKILVELKLKSRQPGSVGYRALIIDLAKAFN